MYNIQHLYIEVLFFQHSLTEVSEIQRVSKKQQTRFSCNTTKPRLAAANRCSTLNPYMRATREAGAQSCRIEPYMRAPHQITKSRAPHTKIFFLFFSKKT